MEDPDLGQGAITRERDWSAPHRYGFSFLGPDRMVTRPLNRLHLRGALTKADEIRALALEGLKPGEIAKRLGIRYQHAYNVLNAGRDRLPPQSAPVGGCLKEGLVGKPALSVEQLVGGGFRRVSQWMLSDGNLSLEAKVTSDVGVYAFVRSGVALYVGVATMGLSKRLYFYGRPGVSQRTSQRINATIKTALAASEKIEVYVATPPDLEWNGLPVHGSAGLELGLIKKYALPWNMRSANR